MKIRLAAKKVIVLVLAFAGAACSTSPTQSIEVGPGGGDAVLYVCRPASYMRPVDKPDIYIQGDYVAELKSGSSFKFSVSKGDLYSIVLSKKPLMYRFKDEILINGTVGEDNAYIIVTPQRNLQQSVAVMLGGAIAESIRQDGASESGGWTSVLVDSLSYKDTCR